MCLVVVLQEPDMQAVSSSPSEATVLGDSASAVATISEE
jgi:hypothetical protein